MAAEADELRALRAQLDAEREAARQRAVRLAARMGELLVLFEEVQRRNSLKREALRALVSTDRCEHQVRGTFLTCTTHDWRSPTPPGTRCPHELGQEALRHDG